MALLHLLLSVTLCIKLLLFCSATTFNKTTSPHLRSLRFSLFRRDGVSATATQNMIMKAAFRSIARAEFLSRRLMLSPTINQDANPLDFTYPLIEGPAGGDFLMVIKLGTPIQHFPSIVDTGSSLVWVQCKPCVNCAYLQGPQFIPDKSSSFKVVSCNSKFCEDVRTLRSSDRTWQKCSNSTCRFKYAYGSGVSIGVLSAETITLDELNGGQQKISNFAFGCAHKTIGDFNSAGLVGLGPAPYSFVSQLGPKFGRKFAYCFESAHLNPDSNEKEEAGFMLFGDSAQSFKHERIQYTPMLTNHYIAEAQFYYVDLQGISIGGKRLMLSPKIFQIDQHGFSGTILDSGTTLSILPSAAIQAVRRAISLIVPYAEVIRAPGDDDGMNLLCYDVGKDVYAQLPSFTFHLHGADLKLPAENTYARFDNSLVCLTMVECSACTDGSSISIIGNVQQQSFKVVYDLEKRLIGFSEDRGCDHNA